MNHSKIVRATVTSALLGLTAALLTAAWLAHIFLSQPRPTELVRWESGYLFETAATPYGGLVGVRVYDVSLLAPKEMKTTETAQVKVVVVPPASIMEGGRVAEVELAARVEGPAFQISPAQEQKIRTRGQLQFVWLIKPNDMGQHKVRATVYGDRRFHFVPTGQTQPSAGQSWLVADVEVLDAIGLSAAQRELLAGLAAAVTLVGTVLAYPFVRWLLDRRGEARTKRAGFLS